MRKRIFFIGFSLITAVFSAVFLEQVLAVSMLVNNTGITINEGQSAIITENELQVTDTDGIYTVFTYTVLAAPVNGLLRNNAATLSASDVFTQGLIDSGQLNYVHDGGETTADSFDFSVTNGITTFVTSTFPITITPVNDAPVAVGDTAVGDEGGSITQVNGSSNTVLGNDYDVDTPHANLTASLVTGPSYASNFNLFSDGTFNYTHNGAEQFSDGFSYVVCDNDPVTPRCDSAVVSISINPVNDKPTATDDWASVDEGGTVTKVNPAQDDSVLDNDSDVDTPHANLTATLVTGPAYNTPGGFIFNSDGTFSYTHDGTEQFSDSFTYDVCDNDSVNPQCDRGTVNINITPVNDAPVAQDDVASVAEGNVDPLRGVDNAPDFNLSVLHDDTDVENDNLTAELVLGPAYASSFNLNSDGTFTYFHDGRPSPLSDSFVYRACDDGTPRRCDQASVSITITPVNDPPTAVDDSFTVDEGATLAGDVNPTPGVCNGNSNDCDEEGDSFVVITSPVRPPVYASSFTLQSNGSFTYVHDGSESTSDSFRYRICVSPSSPLHECDEAEVTINITPVNDAPIPNTDLMTVPRGTTSTTLDGGGTSLLANDTDPENNSLTLTTTPVSGPAHGTVTLNTDGTFSYTHDDSGDSPDEFTYQVCDNGSPQECATGTVTINIGPRPISFLYLPLILNDYPSIEPNNSACEAYGITLNNTYTFNADDREDYYRITLNQTSTLTINMMNATAQGGNSTQLIVYGGSCTNVQFIASNGDFTQEKELTLPNLAAGTYFVRVYSDPVPNEAYTLRVDSP